MSYQKHLKAKFVMDKDIDPVRETKVIPRITKKKAKTDYGDLRRASVLRGYDNYPHFSANLNDFADNVQKEQIAIHENKDWVAPKVSKSYAIKRIGYLNQPPLQTVNNPSLNNASTYKVRPFSLSKPKLAPFARYGDFSDLTLPAVVYQTNKSGENPSGRYQKVDKNPLISQRIK